jgi:hypothetical protein
MSPEQVKKVLLLMKERKWGVFVLGGVSLYSGNNLIRCYLSGKVNGISYTGWDKWSGLLPNIVELLNADRYVLPSIQPISSS